MPDYENFDAANSDEDNYLTVGEARKQLRSEVASALRDIGVYSAQTQAGVDTAIRELKARHADFEERRPAMLAVLEQIPVLKDAIGAAETNPSLASTLVQMYELTYLAAQGTQGSPSGTPSSAPSNNLSSEDTQYQAALASQKVDLSPERRKDLISRLEEQGVLDIEF
jgi:hypothetical protein